MPVTASASTTYTATYTAQTATGYSGEVLADSPRAYWRLGEASGTSAADSSGNNRTGTYLNTPTLSQTGALTADTNTAVAFNGTPANDPHEQRIRAVLDAVYADLGLVEEAKS